jgi:hypothetical protein
MDNKFSPLMDPILLDTSITKPSINKVSLYLDKFSHFNWFNIIINFIVPLVICIFVLSQLKNKYQQKQDLYNEYAVFE